MAACTCRRQAGGGVGRRPCGGGASRTISGSTTESGDSQVACQEGTTWSDSAYRIAVSTLRILALWTGAQRVSGMRTGLRHREYDRQLGGRAGRFVARAALVRYVQSTLASLRADRTARRVMLRAGGRSPRHARTSPGAIAGSPPNHRGRSPVGQGVRARPAGFRSPGRPARPNGKTAER